MSLSSRLAVLVALLGVLFAPLATLHPAFTHLHSAGESGFAGELTDGAVVVLLVLVATSLIPLLNCVPMVLRAVRARRALETLAESSIPVVDEGLRYLLVPLPGVVFFTAGVFRPRIFVSHEARVRLSTEAFHAALLHEREHQRRHHVAWRLALSALDATFWPIPRIRRSIAAQALDCEFAADRAALKGGADREHLFDAMVAAARWQNPQGAVGLTSDGTLKRLELLAGASRQDPETSFLPVLSLAGGLALLPLTAHVLFWFGAVCL